MRATIKDLAQIAEVSETTVSLAFQPGSRISEATRKKVLTLARKISYFPNSAARNLRSGKSKIKSIGFLVTDINNPFYSLMVQTAGNAALSRGYELFISDSQWDHARESAEIQYMIESRVDGILACITEKDFFLLQLLESANLPYLLLDTVSQNYKGSFVINDLAAAADMAVNHLLEVGCRKIAMLSASEKMSSFSAFQIMHREFEKCLKLHSLDFSPDHIIHGGLTIDAGIESLDNVLEKIPDVDGIFCANSLCALGVIEAADRRGIKIGNDLAVLGIDEFDLCKLSRISLTTISQPYEQIAQMALDALISSIEQNQSPDIHVSLKPRLLPRQSTANKKLN